jgi:ATP-dependent Clp protease adapter protein ClpS
MRRRDFIAWIPELLGLLATASGMVLVVDFLGWWTVPVTIIAFYLLRLAGLWGAVYSALTVLGIHLLVSIIPPLAVLASILPRPAPPELLAFGVLAVLALSRRTGRTSPPMARISQNLDRSLRQAVSFAEERNQGRATPEHLLVALTNDPDAAPVMQACHVDIEAVRHTISSSLAVQRRDPEGASARPHPRIPAAVQRAVERATRSGNQEVNGAHVLVEMLAEPVGEILRQAGMTRFDAVNYISHGVIGHHGFGEGETPTVVGEQAVATGPAMLEVKLLNDDFTPMEFVVGVLQHFFDYDAKSAAQVMLDIHRNGVGVCGMYPSDIARLKATQVLTYARVHEHPLRCVLGEP